MRSVVSASNSKSFWTGNLVEAELPKKASLSGEGPTPRKERLNQKTRFAVGQGGSEVSRWSVVNALFLESRETGYDDRDRLRVGDNLRDRFMAGV